MKREEALNFYKTEVDNIKEAGLFKGESPIASPQGAKVTLTDGRSSEYVCKQLSRTWG